MKKKKFTESILISFLFIGLMKNAYLCYIVLSPLMMLLMLFSEFIPKSYRLYFNGKSVYNILYFLGDYTIYETLIYFCRFYHLN